MKKTALKYSDIPQLSKFDVAYNSNPTQFDSFIAYRPDFQSFAETIEQRKKFEINRELLVEVLMSQYSKFQTRAETANNIAALAYDNTFTVITAHQPSLLLGPLYFIYKIVTTIKLANQLNLAHPGHTIVPVFITGGEDHDFEEVNHINIFNKKLEWKNDEKGSVGMMSTRTLQDVLAELKPLLGNSENATEIFDLIEKNYTQFDTYQVSAQGLINDLFGRFGLVVLNMNNALLKSTFRPIIKAEILQQPTVQIVQNTQNELGNLGYKAQAFSREINFFYLEKGIRERIILEKNIYKVLNTKIEFTESSLLEEIDKHPEHFSPNVIMRPLYQESILPNLAYIGGGGELAYWIERKAQFEHFNVFYPMLLRRNSVLWLDKNTMQRVEKYGLTPLDLFGDTDLVVKQYLHKNASVNLNLQQEKAEITAIFDRIKALAHKIDTTLEATVAAENIKQSAVIDQLESRLLRAEKQKNEVVLNQIKALMQKAAPNGGLQERFENFLPYYVKYGTSFFDILIENLDPISTHFDVLSEE